MGFKPDLHQLHHALAYRPGRESVNIRVDDRPGDGIFATVDNLPEIRLADEYPDYGLGDPAKTIAAIMRHYPVPVTINGEPVNVDEFPTEASLKASYDYGDLMHPTTVTGKLIRGDGYPTILVENVRYELGVHTENKNSQDAIKPVLGISWVVEIVHSETPNYARATHVAALPNYRWDQPDNRELRNAEFSAPSRNGFPLRCNPPPAAQRALQQAQLPAIEQEARTRVSQWSDAAGISEPHYMTSPHQTIPSRFRTASPTGRGVGLIPYGRPATMDREHHHDQATRYCLTHSLYLNADPAIDVVPVEHGLHPPDLNIVCAGVTVVTAQGETVSLKPHRDGYHPDLTADDQPSLPYEEANCRSITAHLEVVHPDGDRERMNLPMDLFCSGQPELENIWLTDQWQAEHAEELAELLFEMYWPQDDPPEWLADDEYQERLEALATALLVNREEGLTLEVRQLTNDFTPRNLPEQHIAAITHVATRHSIIYQPNPADGLPTWLTAAVAGANPGMPRSAVHELAQAIHGDPDVFNRLQATLSPPPAP